MDPVEIGSWWLDGIDLAKVRDKWRGLVNAVMTIRIP
jgi:hypothetical protein